MGSLARFQEFVDTRRTVNNAPPAAFSKDPPLELRNAPGLPTSSDLVGYLSLAIFPSHVDSLEKRAKAASLVQGLRNYLHYHIKASKTYLHIRMRKRVDLLLQGTSTRQFGDRLDRMRVTHTTVCVCLGMGMAQC